MLVTALAALFVSLVAAAFLLAKASVADVALAAAEAALADALV